MISEKNQNFWHMAAIQGASLGLPAMVIGEVLAKSHGAGTAVLSIFLGNLFLWIIGLSMISMTYSNRSHALQNVKIHLGNFTAWFGVLVLVLAFLTWFSFEVKAMTNALDSILSLSSNWSSEWSLKVGAFSGCIISLLAIGGIKLIRWVCVIFFPFLLFYVLYALFTSKGTSPTFAGTWGLSFSATVTTSAVILPGMINIPTFFRHGRSIQDAYLALTLMVLFTAGFQIASIYLHFLDISLLAPQYTVESGLTFALVMLIAFIALSTLCINLVNIYFATAAIEMIRPKTEVDFKNYTLFGLGGTLIFGIIQIGYVMNFINNLTSCYIAVLGVTLLQGFLVEIIVKHRPRCHEKIINSFCFFLGCGISTYTLLITENSTMGIAGGMLTSVLAFILMIFIEESIWSFRKLLQQKK